MRAYFRFVLGHRVTVLILCLVVTAASGVCLTDAVIATSIKKMFFGDRPQYARYLERMRKFANDEVFIIAYEDDDPLAPASLARLARAIARTERMPDVARTDSLLNAQRIWAEGGATLHVERYAKLAREAKSDAERQALLAALRKDDQLRDLLISADGRHTAVVVELEVDPDRLAERTPGLVTEVFEHFRDAGFDPRRLHRAGIPALLGEIMDQTQSNLKLRFPISILALLGVVLLLFRRLAPVALVMGVSGLSVVWTMAFARLLDRELSIFLSMVPAVILIVAFSDVIHLWSAYQLELRRGKTHRDAILASATDVGTACLLTSLTTFVGFVCLSLVPTPMFRLLGVVLGFGVATALLVAMTLVPIALSFIRPKVGPIDDAVAGGARATHLDDGWLDAVIGAFARLSAARPRAVIGAFALLLGLAVAGTAVLNIETEIAERIDEDSDFRRDKRYFERHFSATNILELFVDCPADRKLTDQEIFARVAALQRQLEALPKVDRVISLVTLLETMHRALGAEGRLPTSNNAIAQYLLLFEISGGEELERLVDFSRRSMRLSLRINDYGVRATYEVGEEARRLAAAALGDLAKSEPTSLSYMMGWWLGSIIEGQRRGLGLSILLIAVMMAIGLRSLRVGVVSMVPNLLPLLCLGGYLGAFVDRVDSDTLLVAMIAVGIGVDDTIHFLMRYRIEAGRTADRALALRRTFAFSGRAIVLTTVVLAVGFAPFATAGYYSIQILGTLLPGVLVLAVLADLLLVPALIQVGVLAFPQEPSEALSGSTGQGSKRRR